jgi:hypothetical protein
VFRLVFASTSERLHRFFEAEGKAAIELAEAASKSE